ncbi:hypothetical protein GCM10020000_40440 [Streptomyces olivoverticillatus]
MLYTAFPHPCPLFGNETPKVTAPSERRHTKVPGWAVGNVGKPGDGPGEKWALPVHRVCRTFRGPQTTPVFPPPPPTGPVDKKIRSDLGKGSFSTVSTGPTTTTTEI